MIKVPPQNIDAEKSVLGSLLIDPESIMRVVEVLTPQDFYKEAHRSIYAAILELWERREPVDIITLKDVLERQQKIDAIGGEPYLIDILTTTPTSANVDYYARIVSEKSLLRKIIVTATTIAEIGYREEEPVSVLLDKAESEIFKISQTNRRGDFISIKPLLHETLERIDMLQENPGMVSGVPTGYSDLDKMIGGLQASDMIVIAARPSMGKTSFALNIAQNVAIKSNLPVAIFSLEMSKHQLVERLVCAEANVEVSKLRTGYLSSEDYCKIADAMGVLSEVPIFIDDTAGISVMEMRTKARKLQMDIGVQLIIIDYIQLMSSRYGGGGVSDNNRVQEVSEISRSIKALARELHVPIIALSQLSRAVEQRTKKIPMLSDLRESGSIEQDADLVAFIYREDYYNPECPDDEKNLAQIIIAKHRNGPTGQIELYFRKEQTRFENFSKRSSEYG